MTLHENQQPNCHSLLFVAYTGRARGSAQLPHTAWAQLAQRQSRRPGRVYTANSKSQPICQSTLAHQPTCSHATTSFASGEEGPDHSPASRNPKSCSHCLGCARAQTKPPTSRRPERPCAQHHTGDFSRSYCWTESHQPRQKVGKWWDVHIDTATACRGLRQLLPLVSKRAPAAPVPVMGARQEQHQGWGRGRAQRSCLGRHRGPSLQHPAAHCLPPCRGRQDTSQHTPAEPQPISLLLHTCTGDSNWRERERQEGKGG